MLLEVEEADEDGLLLEWTWFILEDLLDDVFRSLIGGRSGGCGGDDITIG